MNDQEIASRVAAGDADAAEQFVREHYPAVFRLLRHLTGRREDAEDLTQQAFLVARAKIDRFRGNASLKTWLHRIAVNEYSQWKRKQKQTAPLTNERSMEEPGYGSFVEGESLLRALATLSDKHREAFILHEVEELPITAVAQILNVPAGTVKARLFYARRNLRAYLEDGSEAHHERKETPI
jgi:RNA polymerase sigma-70 factor (ECF subfamily)